MVLNVYKMTLKVLYCCVQVFLLCCITAVIYCFVYPGHFTKNLSWINIFASILAFIYVLLTGIKKKRLVKKLHDYYGKFFSKN